MMQSLASETEISLEIAILEAKPLNPESAASAAYPYPALVPTGRLQSISMPVILLENRWLKVILLPDLGGRIAQIESKGDGFQYLSFDPTFQTGGPRGVEIQSGIEVVLNDESRLNSLGPVESDFTEDEHGARAIVHERAAGEPLAWHLFVTLPPERACIELELRVYNRSWNSVAASVGLLIPPGAFVSLDGEDRVAVEFAPHQTETFQYRLLPSRFTGESVCSEDGVLTVGQTVSFEPVAELSGRIEAQLAAGEFLSAPFVADPSQPFVSELPGEVARIAAINLDGEVIARLPSPLSAVTSEYVEVINSAQALSFPRASLGEKAHFANLAVLNAVRSGSVAIDAIDHALAVNSEDPWLWWLRNRQGTDSDESLLNAHYLAPFEPALRAQAFLNQNHQLAEPSPLVVPLAENPDALVDVACQLFELREYEDLARWVDEALRHREVPMLRYLLASALLETGKMDVEASQHLAQAALAPINPPYPWRHLEFLVLTGLQKKFPNDQRLADLIAMIRGSRYNPE